MSDEVNRGLPNEGETPASANDHHDESEAPGRSQPRLRLSPLSSKEVEQRRAAARKSTGPRTLAGKARVAMNSLKHGRNAVGILSYAQSLQVSMKELGEDPEEFSRLREGFLERFRPAGLPETMLVEDLVSIRWQRRRLERAHAALLARRVQELEVEHQRKSLQVTQEIIADIPASQLRMGLIWNQESATKYQKLLEWLDELKARLEVGEFTDVETTLGWIYGPNPTTRGALIRGLFLHLAETKANNSTTAGHRRTLSRELEAEISSITQQYHLYIRQNVEVTPAMRDECLAPTAEQRWLMREMNQIDRQIERKTRLLKAVQNSQAEGPDEAGSEEESACVKPPETGR